MNLRPNNPDDLKLLSTLLPRMVDNQLDSDEEQELVEVLQRSTEAQVYYLHYLQMHAELSGAWGMADNHVISQLNQQLPDSVFEQAQRQVDETAKVSLPTPSSLQQFSEAILGVQAVVAALVFVIGALAVGLFVSLNSTPNNSGTIAQSRHGSSGLNSGNAPPAANGLAARTRNVVFTSGLGEHETPPIAAVVVRSDGDPETNLVVGSRLTAGTLKLLSGTMQMEFMGGAVIALEGPAELRIHSKDAATLLSGAISAHVPPRAQGFVLNAPKAAIVDLGTDFGVRVTPAGISEVEVLSGEVELSVLGDDGNTLSSQHIHEASRIRINGEGDPLQAIESGLNDLPIISGSDNSELPLLLDYVDTVRRDQPTLYWRFDDTDGSVVLNEMPGNHSASVYGLEESDDSIRFQNGYARFDRCDVKRYLVSENAIEGLNERPYSIEFWMKPDDLQHATCVGIVPENRTDPRMFLNVIEIVTDTFMIHEPGAIRFLHRTPPDVNYEVGTNAFTPGICVPGQWQHVVTVKRTDAMEIYVNGKLVRHVSLAPGKVNSLGNFHVIVGQLTANETWRQFSGAIDEFAIYKRDLSAEEIAEHYQLVDLTNQNY
ncbi:LamG-like jellyroll fold domain-containing protein [Neorhodopirellula lusitana]|uniref:LamG-like jellyroll fold domain-containing protein n=1 Tax=Neorhodopirellula lusitana TaxID=445327 RepID=UPI00384DDF7E